MVVSATFSFFGFIRWTVHAQHGSKEWITLRISRGSCSLTRGVPQMHRSMGPIWPLWSLGEIFHAVGVMIW